MKNLLQLFSDYTVQFFFPQEKTIKGTTDFVHLLVKKYMTQSVQNRSVMKKIISNILFLLIIKIGACNFFFFLLLSKSLP